MYAQDRKGQVFNSFDNAVAAGLGNFQKFSGQIDALVVRAVHYETVSVQFMENASRQCLRKVILIAFYIFVGGGSRKMLFHAAAEKNVNKLHALANAKNRFLMPDEQIQRLNLKDIQFRIDISGTFIFLSEKSGRNIAAAG